MDRIQEIPSLLKQMQDAEKHYFESLKPSDLKEDLCVVYAITNFHTNEVCMSERQQNFAEGYIQII